MDNLMDIVAYSESKVNYPSRNAWTNRTSSLENSWLFRSLPSKVPGVTAKCQNLGLRSVTFRSPEPGTPGTSENCGHLQSWRCSSEPEAEKHAADEFLTLFNHKKDQETLYPKHRPAINQRTSNTTFWHTLPAKPETWEFLSKTE